MLTSSLVLATITTVGFGILFYKLPPRLRNWLSKRYLLLDAFLAWAVFSMMGFAIVGLLSAGLISLFVSVYLWWYKTYSQQAVAA